MSVGVELSLSNEERTGFQSQGKDRSSLEARAQKTGLRQEGEGFPALGASSPRARLESCGASPDGG